MFAMKVGPALAAGCTMLVKPAEQTPLSALYYAHLAKLAGLPDGVLNVVTGYGRTVGAAITSHMDIYKVSFTGSTEVGRLVMQAAALSNLKHVSLELGGKSPFIVFYDADIDKIASLALHGTFINQVDKNQYERVLKFMEIGKKEGATLLTGGGKLSNRKGYYIEPTIFTDVSEEIFGPVMSILKFKTVEDVIKRANATKYGLATCIMTNDLNIANRVSRSIRAGDIWINCFLDFDIDLPFGGYKMSGFGREMGLESLNMYLHVKSVATPIYDSPWL
ncbi:hypothetical protein RD792_006178 [Penstemon davidsonii]|uniref:Aldehyde dehydrogenase domain-containing protein n=1 Tax=Penstemon davidsonii TaxID=160366 RepID=A0ABR0DC70_9LAMI|nr:hypothetical protein RD792_006178 [Penstemon davidsonii]